MQIKSDLKKKKSALRERLNLEIENFQHLESRLSDGSLVSNPEELKTVSREHSRMNSRVQEFGQYLDLLSKFDEAKEILEDESADRELIEMAREEVTELNRELNARRSNIEMMLIPADPDEGKNIIMEIRAGTGGEEAALFVADLFQMYLRFAEKSGYKIEGMTLQKTELGGYKEVIFALQGETVYELLHQEAGGHRVQRIPTTESGGRIHTSAVTVAVMIEAEEEEIVLDDRDLKIDVFRASGAGGQHVNKTESAIRMLHIPTGIVVNCQDERSQLKNKAKALRVLRTRILEKQSQEKQASDSAIKREQIGSGDRSERIRTYNFPQGRITDHRVGYTSYNLARFLDGEIEELLNLLVRSERERKIKDI